MSQAELAVTVPNGSTPRPRWLVLRVVLLAAAAYAALTAAWPAVGPPYKALCHGLGDVFVGLPLQLRGVDADFSRYKRATADGRDSKVVLRHAESEAGRILLIDFRRKAWLPLSLLLALLLATPATRRRWRRALFSALVLFHAVLIARLWLCVLHGLSRQTGLSVLALPPLADRGLTLLLEVAYRSYLVTWFLPVAIWLVIAAGDRPLPSVGARARPGS